MKSICEKEVRKCFKGLSTDIREVREDVRSDNKNSFKNSSKEKKAVSKDKIITGEAALTASHLLNLTLQSSLLLNVTPHKMFYNKKPDTSHLCVFGAHAFAHVPLEMQTKLRENVFSWVTHLNKKNTVFGI